MNKVIPTVMSPTTLKNEVIPTVMSPAPPKKAEGFVYGGWRIRYYDANNWCLEPTTGTDDAIDKKRHYYPDFVYCVQALARKKLSNPDYRTLEDVVAQIKKLETLLTVAVERHAEVLSRAPHRERNPSPCS